MLSSSQKSHVSRERHAAHAVGSQNGRVVVLCGVLFFSGTGALIFETLWLRLSGLAFGNSTWAAALILSSFMAGLALGNALAASSRIRRWRPLYFYAVLEILVAFFGCTIVFGLPIVGDLMRTVWQMLWNYQPTLLGLRFVVSIIILLVPTKAMGLTLQVIIEDSLHRIPSAGLGFGSLLAGAIHRLSARPKLLPVLLLAAAIFVLLSYLFFPGELIPVPTGVFDLHWWQIAVLCVALMFPVALLSGILFPCIAGEV